MHEKDRAAAATVLAVFLKALCEFYETDSVAPGIVLSWLPDRKVFYCSVRRYSLHTHALRSRVVITAVSRVSPDKAVLTAMRKWQDEVRNPRQDNLDLFMKEPLAELDEERMMGTNPFDEGNF